MRLLLSCLLFTGWLSAVQAAPPSRATLENMVNVMAGDYVILGRKPDSAATYTGHLTLHARGTRFAFTRTVAGRTDRGTATFVQEPFLEAYVLQMTVLVDGKPCTGRYEWSIDHQNYARFTGFLYPANGKSAGLEAWLPE